MNCHILIFEFGKEMGRNIFQIEALGGVLERVVDRVMVIPRGRRLVVKNALQKIVFVQEGQVRALINGEVVGDLGPGDALVVPGACKQSYLPLLKRREMRLRVLVIVFRNGAFAYDQATLRAVPVAGAKADDSQEDFIREHFGRVQVRSGVLTPAVAEAIKSLRREATEKAAGYRLRAMANVLLLITEIARREAALAPVTKLDTALSRAAWQVEQVKNFLLEHHADELTLEDVARHVRLSAEHLARTFRKETGQTVFGYVEHLRVEQARAQLAGSSLTVNEVAAATGFGTASQLCRTFKRVTGETPLAYRLKRARESEFSPSVMEEVVV
jgi:AraC-like DNA-binding protein